MGRLFNCPEPLFPHLSERIQMPMVLITRKQMILRLSGLNSSNGLSTMVSVNGNRGPLGWVLLARGLWWGCSPMKSQGIRAHAATEESWHGVLGAGGVCSSGGSLHVATEWSVPVAGGLLPPGEIWGTHVEAATPLMTSPGNASHLVCRFCGSRSSPWFDVRGDSAGCEHHGRGSQAAYRVHQMWDVRCLGRAWYPCPARG